MSIVLDGSDECIEVDEKDILSFDNIPFVIPVDIIVDSLDYEKIICQ